jgi:sugar lactone lactonase YvrE
MLSLRLRTKSRKLFFKGERALRYLNSAVLLAVVGSVAAFACGGSSATLGASINPNPEAGEAGVVEEGGTNAGGTSAGGSAGKGGTNAGGSAGKAGADAGGSGGTGGAVGQGGATGGEAGVPNEGGAGGEQLTTGSLTVTVTGVPGSQTTSVAISGPDGFSQNVSATTTLNGLEPGTYTVSATPTSIRVSGAQVDSVFDAAVTGTGSVEAGSTASIAVSYAQRPGTGMMWVTNWLTRNAFGFSPAQLAATGAQTDDPAVSLIFTDSGTGSTAASSLAFSSEGDAWVGDCKPAALPQAVSKFPRAKFAANGVASPDVVISLPSIDNTYTCASALAFDASGNLWVGMYSGHILRFNASDLAVTGAPAPAVTLTSTAYLNGILDLTFDSAGNLFVAPYLNPVVSRLSAEQLTTSNSAVVPAVQLALPGVGAGGLALSAAGNLWVSDYNTNSLLEIAAADLNASKTPVPAVKLTGVPGPEQLAFDGAGNLWVAAYNNNKVYAFAAADLTTGGAPTPLTTLSGGGTLSATFAVRFDPGAP